MSNLRTDSIKLFQQMQQEICTEIEALDGKQSFKIDTWDRPDIQGAHGGGGKTAVLTDGAVFEKAGVNFSEVYGTLPSDMSLVLTGEKKETPFFATGTSLVIHPSSPMIPTIHANCRYLEVNEKKWFGGGIDLTPYVLNEVDGKEFHTGLKDVCDKNDLSYYPEFKINADKYFYIPHRNETRGIGGIFFDYLGKDTERTADTYFNFVRDVALSFNSMYSPIVKRNRDLKWSEEDKRFQLIRRGRYVEFNLVYDRGTLFGLKTQGRTESILMSLPLHASWEYDYQPLMGSKEAELIDIFKNPREWV